MPQEEGDKKEALLSFLDNAIWLFKYRDHWVFWYEQSWHLTWRAKGEMSPDNNTIALIKTEVQRASDRVCYWSTNM